MFSESPPPHSREPRGRVHLLIGVKPASTSAADAEQIALDCGRVLSRHDISDVECIVQEATVSRLVTGPTGEYQMPGHGKPDEASSGATPLSTLGSGADSGPVQDSDGLGSAISASNIGSYGTKGLYLDVTDSEEKTSKVALTCRHVAIPDELKLDESLAFQHGLSTLRTSQVPISQMSDEQLQYEKRLDNLSKTMRDLMGSQGPLNDLEQCELRRVSHEISHIEPIVTQLRLLPRPVGHVAFAPPLEVVALTPTSNWPVDWAIVALDPTMHRTDLSTLSNSVSVQLSNDVRDTVLASFREDDLGDDLPTGVMPLRGIISEEEIWSCHDYKDLVVAKYGATTGLTYGVSNNFLSFTHQETSQSVKIIEEWSVIGMRDLTPGAARTRIDFSAPGDSGSCVWDARNGRIGGQLRAGAVWESLAGGHVVGPVDVTYITPIARILADMNRHGLTVSTP